MCEGGMNDDGKHKAVEMAQFFDLFRIVGGRICLSCGVSTIFQRLNIPVYQVQGIASADIKVAVTADPDTPPAAEDYEAANIEIGEVEIAVIDEGRISVEVSS